MSRREVAQLRAEMAEMDAKLRRDMADALDMATNPKWRDVFHPHEPVQRLAERLVGESAPAPDSGRE